VVVWGDNSKGQTNVPVVPNNVKLIAAGGDHCLASVFSPLIEYPVNVTNDLLLVYNTNSTDSATVVNFYLQNRPMVGGANVLGIGVTNSLNYETVSPSDFTNLILAPVRNWLTGNPTKRPQYMILFLNVPDRVAGCASDTNNYPFYCSGGTNVLSPSVSCQLATAVPGWSPFITHINMNGTNDCIGYINKLASFGSNYSPGELIISASAGGYENTNYIIDNIRNGNGHADNYTSDGTVLSPTTNALLGAGVLSSAIFYADGTETITNGVYYNLPHITNAQDIAGYVSWGAHSSLGSAYATNGDIQWTGNSGWWLIKTVESYNGLHIYPGMGYFIQWFSGNAFGGTNYSNTPIGAVSSVNEPGTAGNIDPSIYFGLWASGKNFGICTWNSLDGPYLQAVGDPFVKK
jgi:hypothetical protein